MTPYDTLQVLDKYCNVIQRQLVDLKCLWCVSTAGRGYIIHIYIYIYIYRNISLYIGIHKFRVHKLGVHKLRVHWLRDTCPGHLSYKLGFTSSGFTSTGFTSSGFTGLWIHKLRVHWLRVH